MSPGGVELADRVCSHGDRTALIDPSGRTWTYAQLDSGSERVARWLLDRTRPGEAPDLAEERIALMIPPGFGWVAALLGVWRAGGIAVPLCVSHPAPELRHVLEDSGAGVILADEKLAGRISGPAEERDVPVGGLASVLEAPGAGAGGDLPEIGPERRAMILYTSGTTGRPKGAVSTHASLTSGVRVLVDAWGWVPEDRILHVLPLHHTHGIVNALLCPLWCGAVCEMMERFDARKTWDRFARGGITVFMAVPTIYRKLEREWSDTPPSEREAWTEGASRLRLMVSGSAALPASLFERWQEVGGHALLERYGMTEIGMALSNPLHGERRAGSVGRPLPGVELRLVDAEGSVVPPVEGASGEIEVRGPGVFEEYWNRPGETEAAFHDGWFRTGDEAILEEGAYRILGRQSVDIIKTGGYKVSALEIERVLCEHPHVEECAVLGVEDAEWGEAVCAALVGPREVSAEEIRRWAAPRMARYKIPGRVVRVDELPRNEMGKVNKPRLRAWFDRGEEEP